MKKEQYIITWSDESYTYPSLIILIIDKIEEFRISKNLNKEEITIWCPFDVKEDMEYINQGWETIYLKQSLYYKCLKEAWYKLIISHIATWQDFFKVEPKIHYDLIISNPPFKWKAEFFKRALVFNKPFALVCPASWLNDWWPYNLFSDKRLQLFISDKRSKFFNKKWTIWNQPTFKAIYYCYNFLQQNDIQWFKLDKSLDINLL